jgi:hypothetical protein
MESLWKEVVVRNWGTLLELAWGSEENHERPSQNKWSRGRDANSRPPEREAEMLPTQPWRSVKQIQ